MIVPLREHELMILLLPLVKIHLCFRVISTSFSYMARFNFPQACSVFVLLHSSYYGNIIKEGYLYFLTRIQV